MRRFPRMSAGTLVIVLAGCATPIEEAYERAGIAAGPHWTAEPADAFGGYYYGPEGGPKRYQPPNIAIRRMRAAQVRSP